MVQKLEIYPEEIFKPGKITFNDIDICQYNKSIEDEKANFSNEDFTRIYRDMCLIREFEDCIDHLKKEGSYRGVEYNHAGPAHLSMGQESAAVGQAYILGVDDHIFGSHRSHSEIMAKGLSAIQKLDDDKLLKIMQGFWDGATLSVVEKGHTGSVKELAVKFLVYGAYAEMFARETGFNRGFGGSMHAFFTPFGIYPNNAIVGGSGPITPGAALYKRVNRKPGIIVCNIGDASFGCGPVWEGLWFASMDQYRQLWDESLGGGLPIIFNCFNNQYGMGGQTRGETMAYEFLARIGSGINPEQMHAERINGYNPLAVIDAMKRKKEILESGKGPVLLDTVTYRQSGHSPSDASSYRSKEEQDRFLEADAIPAYRKRLVESGVAAESEMDAIKDNMGEIIFEMFKKAIDLEISPRLPINSEVIAGLMFSNKVEESLDDREPEVNHPMSENPRVIQNAGKERYAFKDGKAVPKMKLYNIRDAIFDAMMYRFYKDPTMVAFGEENRDWGGAFAVYRGMTEALPYHRLFNSPISEAAIVGSAVGYALEGGRAVAELMYCDFMGRAGDEIFNQLSKWQAMSAGILKMPVTLRISVGVKYGAQHSQDWSALVNHIPGLKLAFPVTPYDAKGIMNFALSRTDPVVFFESQSIYDMGEMFVESGVPEGYYEVEEGQPIVRRSGSDLTIVTLGPILYNTLKVADELQEKYNVSAEVIDLRWINPLDYTVLIESIKKTGKVLLAQQSVERGSFMHNVASNLSQLAFDYLDAAPAVLGCRNWITPAAELEAMFFPQLDWFLDMINAKLIPLNGYTPKTNQTNMELLSRYQRGV